MTSLKQDEYYDLIRGVNWTPKYVPEEEIFPEEMSGSRGIPMAQWEAFDEPYKVTYGDYVQTQREKDAGVYSVKAGLERANYVKTADPGWVSTLQAHYGALAVAEYAAATAEARMARFSKAPGNRVVATFGMLDEMRHGQLQLFFSHEHTRLSRQWDWAHKALYTNEWAAIAARHMFDDMMFTRDAISTAIMLTFAFETGFTNMQFLGLSADAAEAGDHTFSNLISSIQTDESRHAQQGGAILKVMVDNGKIDDAQHMIDVIFWRTWKLFSVLTGPIMDYYTPLEHRKQSFKEFMEEWIIGQFVRQLDDLGLKKPWYWDTFVADLDQAHHAIHVGVWFYRPTVWWNPAAGASPEERAWLEQKYPGWNTTFGRTWDVITDNIVRGRLNMTLPETLPLLCNMSNVPIVGTPGDKWNTKDYPLVYEGRLYHFGSPIDRWCFEQEPERYKGHMNFIDRVLAGLVQPPDMAGALAYMGLAPGEMGEDAHDYAWAAAYQRKAAE